jgi:hypothetical protein
VADAAWQVEGVVGREWRAVRGLAVYGVMMVRGLGLTEAGEEVLTLSLSSPSPSPFLSLSPTLLPHDRTLSPSFSHPLV